MKFAMLCNFIMFLHSQDDSPGEGDLPFQLSSQSSSSHSQLTVDLPVHILQVQHVKPLGFIALLESKDSLL